MPPELFQTNPEDLAIVYYLLVLTPEGKFMKEIECGLRFNDADRAMQLHLGEGMIAIIKKESILYSDYIPF